ncbi:inositol monophosphatase family protein [Streptomyces sp. MAR4 CNX-425]|uniref:inositol monophosphatase family protein n=1 Tax=Streptomyces sp. MAR4 CNX-425 TaxID=3406343 RepID=UPI003B50B824
MTDLPDLLKIADGAVELARSIVVSRDPGEITAKGDRDMASEVDFAVEASVRHYLADLTPDISFVGEEEGKSPQEGRFLWALDPVDGTANFVRGIPLCCVSLGLFDGKRCVLGVVDLPFMNARYHATEGGGAFCGSRRIQASGTRDLNAAIVSIGDYAVGTGAQVRNERRLAITERLAGRVQRIRMWGTAALDLVWVAEGKTDASVIMSNNPWDLGGRRDRTRSRGACRLRIR